MSNPKFIISVRNMSKCEPDCFYYCGARAPVNALSACISPEEVLLDADVECALTLQSLDHAAFAYGHLQDLGYEGVQVFQKITTFEKMVSTTFDEMVQLNRINSILSSLDTEDMEYLQDIGVLDLTIVT